MIAGRNPALWLGAITALIDVIVLLNIVSLTQEQIVGLNALAAALIGLVANETDTDAANLLPH